MPTNRTRRTRASQGLDSWKLMQLVTGKQYLLAGPGCGYFPEGATGGCNHWTQAEWDDWRGQVAADWQKHGAAILRWWNGHSEQFTAQFHTDPRTPGGQPWALTEFGEPDHG